MIRAYRLYTGPDGNSHVVRGSVRESKLVEAQTILFKETQPQSSYDWHNDPVPQYVITLAGVLEFTTLGGETFTINPGEVLLAEDHTGSGHKWRLSVWAVYSQNFVSAVLWATFMAVQNSNAGSTPCARTT